MLVFDIKRFATHDGNGIRTTVFFKGCPLRCVWCQNPEGLQSKRGILYLESKCIHCHTCLSLCKKKGIQCIDEHLVLNRNASEDWEEIVDACCTQALCFDSKEYTIDELLHEIKKDEVFFKNGGGVTFSGGEPLLQEEDLYQLCKLCKENGIHTAIETSLYADLELLKKMALYLDQIYCDCKIFDEEKHIKYTGVSNAKILENLRWLLTSPFRDKVIVRTPLIPGMTATHSNIASISSFLSSLYEDVSYELLNYNPLAKSKYAYLDMEYCFQENPELYSKEQMDSFYAILHEHNIKNIVRD